MVGLEKMKERYPRAMMVVQGLWIIILSTILAYVIFAPFLIFGADVQLLVDFFTYPVDFIPLPYNLVGLPLLPFGMFLVIWANYVLLHIGKIGLRNREPMQRPSTLVQVGPYRFTRNPIYVGNLIMAIGLTIVWSGLVMLLCTIIIFIVFRHFIIREETILEEEFGDEYRDFKNRVRRWL
ncbi:MAG: methyltransferase family protein [Candidatus Thorarchaeota archaeon]